HARARLDVSIDANTLACRPHYLTHYARTRTEVVSRILGVDTALDRAARARDVGKLTSQSGPVGDRDLLGDQVDARHRFRHRMLHLDPGVHFQEVEGAGLPIDQELDGAGATVRQTRRESRRGLMQRAAQARLQSRGRCLLDQLLIATLHRAVPLTQMDHLALAVAEHLHLDVPAAGNVAFQIDARVTESRT